MRKCAVRLEGLKEVASRSHRGSKMNVAGAAQVLLRIQPPARDVPGKTACDHSRRRTEGDLSAQGVDFRSEVQGSSQQHQARYVLRVQQGVDGSECATQRMTRQDQTFPPCFGLNRPQAVPKQSVGIVCQPQLLTRRALALPMKTR